MFERKMDQKFFEDAENIKKELENLIERNKEKILVLENKPLMKGNYLHKVKCFLIGMIFFSILLIVLSKAYPEINKYINYALFGYFAIISGSIILYAKEKQRNIYAIIEIIVGIIVIGLVINKPNEATTKIEFIIGIAGGFYIIVRGLENFIKSQKEKQIGIWLKKHFNIGD
jgi:uncharacterized membrane protein HdeD (DUF308 family)